MRQEPRRDIVAERAVDEDQFEAADGPFRHYERRLSLEQTEPGETSTGGASAGQTEPGDAGTGDAGIGDAWRLTETTSYRLAVPVWAWLFHFPVRSALRKRRDAYGYWWAPPDRLSARAATVLGLLCTIQVVDGYLGTVLTATLTFAADEFGRGNTAQGVLMGVVRAGVLIALVTAALADRHGRKRLLLATGLGSCLITAMGALAPGLWFLGGTQLVARGLSTALGILIVILAAEEMPARSPRLGHVGAGAVRRAGVGDGLRGAAAGRSACCGLAVGVRGAAGRRGRRRLGGAPACRRAGATRRPQPDGSLAKAA